MINVHVVSEMTLITEHQLCSSVFVDRAQPKRHIVGVTRQHLLSVLIISTISYIHSYCGNYVECVLNGPQSCWVCVEPSVWVGAPL